MVWGGAGVPGLLGYAMFFVFPMINKHVQFSQVVVLATNHRNIAINMVRGTRCPGIFGIFNFHCIFNDEQTDSFLANENLGHQIRKYSDDYGLGARGPGTVGICNFFCIPNGNQTTFPGGGPGVPGLLGYAVLFTLSMINTQIHFS